MMYYSIITIVFLFCGFIYFIVINHQKSKLAFENKIKALEDIIIELTRNLDSQSQKLKLSDDLKLNMQQSKNELSSKIVDMNLEMFQVMFPKKKL